MQDQEFLILLRHLALVQQRIDQQLRSQQQEIGALQQALMQSRAARIIDLSRRSWLAQPASTNALSEKPAPKVVAPPALIGSLRQKLRAAELDTRKTIGALAAEVIICQTGCLSHEAYWRVQEYCRRHGKRCLLLESDEVASFLPLPEPSSS